MVTELFLFLIIFCSQTVAPYWKHLCSCTSEYTMFVTTCFLSQLVTYFLGCLPYVLLDVLQPSFMQRYKIQPSKYPSPRLLLSSSYDVLVSFCTVVLPLVMSGGLAFSRLGISRDGPIPQWHVILIHVAYFFVVEDFLNYWIHRALHLPWLYRHVHSVHHIYDAPFSIPAAFAHPVEIVALGIPTFMGPLMVGPHMFTLIVWQTFRNFEAIDVHSGYELPLSLKTFFPAYGGTEHHDYHHYMHSGNFASVFTWCDRLYGTSLGYEIYQEKKRLAKQQ